MVQEYEKRLLAKDHDLKCSQAQLEHVRYELAEAKKVQAEGSNLLPAPEAHESTVQHPMICILMQAVVCQSCRLSSNPQLPVH